MACAAVRCDLAYHVSSSARRRARTRRTAVLRSVESTRRLLDAIPPRFFKPVLRFHTMIDAQDLPIVLPPAPLWPPGVDVAEFFWCTDYLDPCMAMPNFADGGTIECEAVNNAFEGGFEEVREHAVDHGPLDPKADITITLGPKGDTTIADSSTASTPGASGATSTATDPKEATSTATDSSTVSPVASSGHHLVYARPLDPKENEALKNVVDARPLVPKDDKNLVPAVEALVARPLDPKDDTNLEADDEILEMTRRCTPLPTFARLVRGLSCEVVTDWVMSGNLRRLTDAQAWRTTDSLECIGDLGIVELHGDMVMEVIDRCTDCCTRAITVGCLADVAITVLARHWASECSRFQNFRNHYDEIFDALVRNLLLLISEAT